MLVALIAAAQAWPISTPEASNFEKTSSYADVVRFMEDLAKRSEMMRLTWIGESTEGRKIPLMIISNDGTKSAAAARAKGKLVVYIQGNIHAGEVEGKEAAQHLLRDLAQGKRASWLRDMVLLVNPIYNADGNEKWGPVERNRPQQDGPKEVGVRPNGQNFDLNRDCIKSESPEMRAALDHVYKPWDPDAMMDLHTTDGTRHGYDLTYAPPLCPNTDPAILNYSREKLLPEVRKRSVAQFGKDLFDYGNATRGENARWSSFECYGRYVTNYAGLRNCIAILSEAAVYIPFKDRVEITERFVSLVLDNLAANRREIIKMRSSFRLPKEMPVRYEMEQGRIEEVPLEKIIAGQPRPTGGRLKEIEMFKMPIFDRFKGTKMARVPAAYVIPRDNALAARQLARHGIEVRRQSATKVVQGAAFTIESATKAAQPFQGHRLLTLEGRFQDRDVTIAEGDFIIPMNQRLAGLAFYMLEPECQDGLAAWGVFGEDLSGAYPVAKLWSW